MFDWYRNRRTCFDKFTRWFSFVSTFSYFIRLLFFKLNSSAWIFSSRIFYSHITKQWNWCVFFSLKWFHFSSISLNTFVHFNRRELLIYTFKQFAQGFHVFAEMPIYGADLMDSIVFAIFLLRDFIFVWIVRPLQSTQNECLILLSFSIRSICLHTFKSV